ncbi:MAG TPA: farnesyl diphosphate synthase [Haloplasmataceae bacterium]
MTFEQFLQKGKKQVEARGEQFLDTLNLAPKLKEAMRYSFTAGGKRLRPLLLLSVLDLFQVPLEKGLNTAVAIEFIHTSSLIHDDLPAMDDDDLRRGKPTNHKVFGEATAILAGDALLIHAFELIASDPYLPDRTKVQLINELSQATGANGMVGGQQLDIENEEKSLTLEELTTVHEHKTGRLLRYSFIAGGLIADADETVLSSLDQASYHLGLAFQIQDDLLDVIGDPALIGKRTHQDEKNRKATFVSLLGIDKTKKRVQFHFQQALETLLPFCPTTSMLYQLLQFIINRKQ